MVDTDPVGRRDRDITKYTTQRMRSERTMTIKNIVLCIEKHQNNGIN